MQANKVDRRIADALNEHRDSMYRVAFSYVHNRDDALDVVQDSCYKALRGYSATDGCVNMKAWLLKIVVNTALDLIRKNSRSSPVEQVPEIGRSDSYEHMELMDMLDKLDDKCKEVLIMRYFEDVKLTDIALITGENLNTVKSRIYRALAQLRLANDADGKAAAND